jgi:hypothetical protein
VDAVLESMKIQTDNFPTKNVFIPSYKNINDNSVSPPLADFVKSQLLLNFDGIQNPKISFWQENLAGFTDTSTNTFTGLPTTTFATPLLGLGNSAYTMFQMLQGWTTPFLDPAKTANSTPFDAMCYAYKTYGASYYEIYVSDIDNLMYQNAFNNWDTTNCGALALMENQTSNDKFSIYPNPAATEITIIGVDELQKATISIVNCSGQTLINTQNPTNIDISPLSNGVYFIKMEQNNQTYLMRFIKN